MNNTNMLYCGMGLDISTPFLMPIKFNTLYVIDLFDRAYSPDGTLEAQKKDILEQLKNGGKYKSFELENLRSLENAYPNNIVLQANILNCLQKFTPCEIVSEKEENLRWHIKLKQNNEEKNIIVFHKRTFLKAWPEEIKDISHLTSFGATFPLSEDKILNQMLRERCLESCEYYLAPYSLGKIKNPNIAKLFNKIPLDAQTILSCRLSTHLPLLKYICRTDANRHKSVKIPQALIDSYENNVDIKLKARRL